MAAGEPFTWEQRDRLERARAAAQARTGIRFAVRVGAVDDDPALFAERLLANLVARPSDPAVAILVSPGQRFVHIGTTRGARWRVTDQAAGLAVLTMTSSFALGDIVNGIVNGLRQLADAAGPDPSASHSGPSRVLASL
ncbi:MULTISPECIES: DUF5130 family protein [Protofrankia]|uniref:TLP18.3, Psb32 and MOLO-1 founding protein of phosphatase n=1 Tax=Protofrankia coriariae TaxID=1562887 RepID=A0ABR5F4C3_9ACTN|nr:MULTISPECIES: DUF5130 family protein [Protofrankia]KLL11535.1 hypothetical protein FrCorBMG51_10825 [Protofrankia coriariae]ONH35664.1 DUF5130 domain-containing protein [Protofrankia sp. BMG5.30]